MSITAADLLYKFSVAAAAGNTTAGTAAGSLGDQISITQIVTDTLNNLFDDVTGDENAASEVEYRCFFLHNNHATLTLQNAVVWLSAEVGGGAVIAISVDTTAITAVGAGTAQAKTVANENTAPAAQAFSAPITKGTALALGNVGPGQVIAIWIRRTAANTGALNNDGVTFRVEGDTAA